MKNMFLIVLMSAGAILLLANNAQATCGCEHHATCTPGYYKNHVALWDASLGNCTLSSCNPIQSLERICCTNGEGTLALPNCTELFNNLSAQGPGSDVIRASAQSYLNNVCFSRASNPCPQEAE